MPELPEIQALTRDLDARTRGARIQACHLTAVSALKTFKPSPDEIKGQVVKSWSRRGKYLVWELEDLWLVVHLARGGWVRWHDSIPPIAPRWAADRWPCGSSSRVVPASTSPKWATRNASPETSNLKTLLTR